MPITYKCKNCFVQFEDPGLLTIHECAPAQLVKSFYFPVESHAHGEALAKFFSNLCGLHFLHQDPIPGTLEEVKNILSESNILKTVNVKII